MPTIDTCPGDPIIRDPLRLALLVEIALSDHEEWYLAAVRLREHLRATGETRAALQRFRAARDGGDLT